MTAYDKIQAGLITQEEAQAAIKAQIDNRKVYKKLPGHVLVEEFIAPYGASLSSLAEKANVPYYRLHKLVRGTDCIDRKMAANLGAFFGNGAQYWLDLQTKFERGEAL